MKLQTATGRVRTIYFAKDRYNIFVEKERIITPAKISNYVTSPSLDGSEEEILINNTSVVQTPALSEYSFQYEDDGKRNVITSFSVVSSETECDSFVNVKGKVTKGADEETVGKNNLRMLKCAITDDTGVLAIKIWEDKIESIKDGCVYQFHGVRVRFCDQSKYLTTTRATRIIKDDDEMIPLLLHYYYCLMIPE